MSPPLTTPHCPALPCVPGFLRTLQDFRAQSVALVLTMALVSGLAHASDTETTTSTEGGGASSLVPANAGFSSLLDVYGNLIADGALPVGQGKWTLVMLWATNCHVCKEQKPKLSAFHDKNKDLNAQVYGIALDGHRSLKKVNRFMAANKVTFPTFVGEANAIMRQYQVLTSSSFRGTPTYLLFDPDGVLKGNNPGAITMDALTRFIERHSESEQ